MEDDQTAARQLVTLGLVWFDIDKPTAETYGSLRSKLFDRYAPKSARGTSKTKRVELLPLPAVNGQALQLEENDLWICSAAVTHDIPLASCEKGLHRILDEAADYTHKLVVP